VRILIQSSSGHRVATSNAAFKLWKKPVIAQGGAMIDDDVAISVHDSDAPKAIALLEQARFNVETQASK